MYRTRYFDIGSTSFAVDCFDDDVRETIEAVFVDLGDGESDGATVLGLERSDQPGKLRLKVPGRAYGDAPLAGLVTQMVPAITRLNLDSEPDHLHLHCAALAKAGRGVLISAASGTGKTTLAAGLAGRGWSYVSDEAVAITADSSTVSGFPKPLSLKPSGYNVISGIDQARVPIDDDSGSAWWHVPVSGLGAPVVDQIRPCVIIILGKGGGYGGEAVVGELHPADAVVYLMGQTMDSQRFGPRAVEALALLAGNCLCASLVVGTLESELDLVSGLVSQDFDRVPVRRIDPAAAVDVDGWKPNPSVRSVLLGDRVVVHDTSGGAIAALDEGGTAIWLDLHGETSQWWSRDAIGHPDAVQFLGQLADAGFLSALASSSEGAV